MIQVSGDEMTERGNQANGATARMPVTFRSVPFRSGVIGVGRRSGRAHDRTTVGGHPVTPRLWMVPNPRNVARVASRRAGPAARRQPPVAGRRPPVVSRQPDARPLPQRFALTYCCGQAMSAPSSFAA